MVCKEKKEKKTIQRKEVWLWLFKERTGALKTPLPVVSLFIFQVNRSCSSLFLSYFNCLFFPRREQEKTTTRHQGLRLMERLYLWMEAFIWRRGPWIVPHNMRHRAAQIATQSPNTHHARTECTEALRSLVLRGGIITSLQRGGRREGEEKSRGGLDGKTDVLALCVPYVPKTSSNRATCLPKLSKNDQNAQSAERNTIKSPSQAKGADIQPQKTSRTTFSLVQQGSCQCWGPCSGPRNIRRQQLN